MTDQEKRPDSGGDKAEHSWPELSFNDLSDKLKDACGRAGWEKLMPVQARAMAAVMHRQDVMVQARTGSGKTGAFVLPLIERIDPEKNHCQALVLLPTRELAKQVADEAEALSGGMIRTVPVYGGVGYGPQIDAFKKGAHLVVGTPGRILDHLMRGSLKIDQLDTIVFDEADRMLSIGFYPDMKQLQSYLPERDINGLMFSATFPPMVLRLSEEFLREPQFISLSEDHMHVAEVSHQFCQVPSMGKERALAKLIEVENPTSAIIFTNTKANCNFVAAVLGQFGYDAAPLSSDLSQSKREQVLGQVRSGVLKFLVATDVAARGIDIPELSHVFLYEPPEDRESYIHRSGRTGRAGAAGVVISLVDLMQKMELNRIATHYRIPLLERELPSDADIRSVVGQRTTALLEARFRAVTEGERKRYELFLPSVEELARKDDTIGHLAMLLDEFYHNSVHGGGVAASANPKDIDPAAEIDADALARSLDAKYGAMKPLSRERMMKFMVLARELSSDDDGKPVLAMLLDDYYFAVVHRAAKAAPKEDGFGEDRPKAEKKKRERKPRPERKPREQAPEADAEAEADGNAGAGTAQPESQPEEAPQQVRPAAETAPEQHIERTDERTENGRPDAARRDQASRDRGSDTPSSDASEDAAQPSMDVLSRLRGMNPLEPRRLDALLPLAEELLGSTDAPAAIAVLLDRFERESRRIDARKAKRKGNGPRNDSRTESTPDQRQDQRRDNRQNQRQDQRQERQQEQRDQEQRDQERSGQERQDNRPKSKPRPEPRHQPEPEPEEVYTGPVHAMQANLWDDDPIDYLDDSPATDTDADTEQPKRKKRPRIRRRRKSS